MAEDSELIEKAEKKMKEGWIKAALTFEAVAVKPEVAQSAIKKHVEMMEKEKGILVYRKTFHESQEVPSPVKGIEKAYSAFCEAEMAASSFDSLVSITIHYGPSSVEILEPALITIRLPEAQNIVNNMSEILHRYAAAGAGGMVIRT